MERNSHWSQWDRSQWTLCSIKDHRMCPFVIYRLKIGIGKKLRRSRSQGRISPAPRVGLDPFPPGGLSPAAPQGRRRGQDRCRGLLIINRGQTKELFRRFWKDQNFAFPGASAPRGPRDCQCCGRNSVHPAAPAFTVPWRGRGVPGASPPSPSAVLCPSALRGWCPQSPTKEVRFPREALDAESPAGGHRKRPLQSLQASHTPFGHQHSRAWEVPFLTLTTHPLLSTWSDS